MELAASDFYTYYSPHRCERRLYLRTIGTPEDPESVWALATNASTSQRCPASWT